MLLLPFQPLLAVESLLHCLFEVSGLWVVVPRTLRDDSRLGILHFFFDLSHPSFPFDDFGSCLDISPRLELLLDLFPPTLHVLLHVHFVPLLSIVLQWVHCL